MIQLPWPADAHRRTTLRREGRPCLLLVDAGAQPPALAGCLEDWVRMPATDVDIEARCATLARRVDQHRESRPHPILRDGVLRVGEAWVSVPPVESRLLAALLERAGSVVSRPSLARAGWPGGDPDRNTLDVHMGRLRRRLTEVGVNVVTVRSRGYLLDL